MDPLGGGGAVCQEPVYILSSFIQGMNYSKLEVFNLLNTGGFRLKLGGRKTKTNKTKRKLPEFHDWQDSSTLQMDISASQHFHIFTFRLLQQVE